MHGMEVHTAVQYRLPVAFVLINNNAQAMCAMSEKLCYGNRHSYNTFAPSRLGAGLAAMFPELPSVDVDDVDGFGAAVQSAL
ncbi:thiamine pyrophosphate-dependent enzyme, partial [Mycobacterium avium]